MKLTTVFFPLCCAMGLALGGCHKTDREQKVAWTTVFEEERVFSLSGSEVLAYPNEDAALNMFPASAYFVTDEEFRLKFLDAEFNRDLRGGCTGIRMRVRGTLIGRPPALNRLPEFSEITVIAIPDPQPYSRPAEWIDCDFSIDQFRD